MSKSVLVVDTPDCCGRCRLLYRGYPLECSYTHNVIHVDSLCSHREKDCPLKPLPEKKNFDDIYSSRRSNVDEIIGWNKCLAEITGGVVHEN